MITLLHIIIALLSVGYAAILIFAPTLTFKPAYALSGGTIASGIAVMVIHPATVAHVCVSGIIFLVVVGLMLSVAKYRKARFFTAS